MATETIRDVYYSGREPFYTVPAHCYNCGETFLMKVTKGYTPCHAKECPSCGVPRHWTFGTIAEAKQLQESEAHNATTD